MISVVLFVLSVLVASVSGWSSCMSGSYNGPSIPYTGSSTNICNSVSCSAVSSSNGFFYTGSVSQAFSVGGCTGAAPCSMLKPYGCDGYSCGPSRSCSQICVYSVRCNTQAEADSVNCVLNPNAPGCAQDTTFHCQNTGGPDPTGYSGTKTTATIWRQINGGVAVKTAELAGSCQDWGWCPDGVDDCDIAKDSLGRNPCRRSGAEFISGARCYYQCPDGTGLACRPVSTDYVAGATWAARCPKLPSAECQPPHSSASSSPSSSPSVSSSSFKPPQDWEEPAGEGENFNYTAILAAIHDTLHIANVQRDFIRRLDSTISFSVGTIADNVIGATSAANGINNRLSTLQQNGVKLEHSYVAKIDSSKDFLKEINDYLRNDSLYSRDTTYNPLLRDIRGAIESLDAPASSGSSAGSSASRDSAFARWWSDYSQDSAAQKGILGKIWDSIKPKRDSVRAADCEGFNGCIAVYKRIDYCKNAWGVGFEECTQGGSPFDGMINVESSILSTLWDAVWGEDSTELSPVAPVDTAPLPRTPAEDSARNSIKSANDSIDLPSIGRTLDSMRARLDSLKTKKDSVKIDVDSTMMDSSEAARYVQHILLPSGTGTACFVCHADLGTFGGLAPDGLAIHIDFSSFGGYNWCDLGRAIVKIMTLVVCISLTLGSWAAAFGYSPKNDA